MKKFVSLAIIAAMVAFSVGGTRRAEAASGQLLTGILSKMEAAHQNLRSMRAAMVQQKHNSQIGTNDTDYGTLIYKPSVKGKGRLRIDYTKPDTRVVSVIGETFTFYQPRINQAVKTSLAKAAKGKTGNYTQMIGLDSSAKSLANNYNIEIVKDELVNGKMTTQLRLVPKGGSSLASIELWVNQDTWLPVQQKFNEHNGDYTLVKLTNMELNPKLADEAFNVSLPSGVKVVDKI